MKILSAEEIRLADRYSIKHEPIASIDLMERASMAFVKAFEKYYPSPRKIWAMAGTGNNGGDALAIARLLSERGHEVHACIARYSKNASPDMEINEQRLRRESNVALMNLYPGDTLPQINEEAVIIDGLFGSGLNRPLSGWPAEIIEKLNSGPYHRVAIDTPSGLFADRPSIPPVFHAELCITFQCPKLAFFMPENQPYIKHWEVVDIGLSRAFIDRLETPWHLTEAEDILYIYCPRNKFDHKGNFGHVLLAAGHKGRIGAAILAAKACLQSGAGLLTVHLPECGYTAMQSAVPEAMVNTDVKDDCISRISIDEKISVVAAGPGIGQEEATATALEEMFQSWKGPLVLDADALNLLAIHPKWWEYIPENSILTPHPGEFARLAGKSKNHFERLEKAREMANEKKIVLVLKGAYTAVCAPDGHVYFNPSGNPGMATAGSGDVLTGVLAAFLAQGYSPVDAARLGVYLHGLAGDLAAEKYSQLGITGGRIAKLIGRAALSVASKDRNGPPKSFIRT